MWYVVIYPSFYLQRVLIKRAQERRHRQLDLMTHFVRKSEESVLPLLPIFHMRTRVLYVYCTNIQSQRSSGKVLKSSVVMSYVPVEQQTSDASTGCPQFLHSSSHEV